MHAIQEKREPYPSIRLTLVNVGDEASADRRLRFLLKRLLRQCGFRCAAMSTMVDIAHGGARVK